jgi:hypothetical protein
MPSSPLVGKVVAALIAQVPVLGPVFSSVRDEIGRERFEAEVMALLHEIARPGRSPRVAETNWRLKPKLVAEVLKADAALAERLVSAAPSAERDRFVYLAAAANASEPRTYEIALEYQFLWRAYHKKGAQSSTTSTRSALAM